MTALSRRRFLISLGQAALVAGLSPVVLADARPKKSDSLGLALGAGGATGLAHIVVIETLEELGLRPDWIAGSSIGALTGGLVACGNDSRALKEIVAEMVPEDFGSWLGTIFNRGSINVLSLIQVNIEKGSLVDLDVFQSFLEKQLGRKLFEDLDIPLVVTATDYWDREAVFFEKGPLIPPVMASVALPGVFPPVQYQGRLLIDGGILNPVPHEVIAGRVTTTIAVDVIGNRKRPEDGMPGYLDLVFNTFDIMRTDIMRSSMKARPPDIYLQPDIVGVRVLDFHKAPLIYEQADPLKEELKRKLDQILG